MKIIFLVITLLILGINTYHIKHFASEPENKDKKQAAEITWIDVPIDTLNDQESQIDQMIRCLDEELADDNLTSVQIDNENLTHFIYTYTCEHNHTTIIKGSVGEDGTLKFKTPEGEKFSINVKTIKGRDGGEENVISISEKYQKVDKDQNTISTSIRFLTLRAFNG